MSLKNPSGYPYPDRAPGERTGRVADTDPRGAEARRRHSASSTAKQFAGYCTAPKLTRKQFDELYEIRLLLDLMRQSALRNAWMMPKSEGDWRPSQAQAGRARAEAGRRMASFGNADDSRVIPAYRPRQQELPHRGVARAGFMHHLPIFRLRFDSQVTTVPFTEHARLVEVLNAPQPAVGRPRQRCDTGIQKSYDRLVPSRRVALAPAFAGVSREFSITKLADFTPA